MQPCHFEAPLQEGSAEELLYSSYNLHRLFPFSTFNNNINKLTQSHKAVKSASVFLAMDLISQLLPRWATAS
jgi:hypothetical protein